MGGAVSAGEDNDELIDNLVEAEYIKSPAVERIFRAVDRGDYMEGCQENAYRDLAWKHGHIHLSAPCIYSEVMESLKLGPGMSFLNLGSGTGYLSTMAGLMLGTYGTNHGVELHHEVVSYATAKLEEFQNNSPAMDKYEFCPPSFVVGNCLLLDTSMHQYDRVYCGASCPLEHENYMKNLVRIGGILVMPLNDNLLQVTRTGETTFEVKNVLPVSFASLVLPNPNENLTTVKLPETHPLSLQEICRSAIRVILRKNIEIENPSLKDKKREEHPKRKRSKRRMKKVIIPIFEVTPGSEGSNDSRRGSRSDLEDSRRESQSEVEVDDSRRSSQAEVTDSGRGSQAEGDDNRQTGPHSSETDRLDHIVVEDNKVSFNLNFNYYDPQKAKAEKMEIAEDDETSAAVAVAAVPENGRKRSHLGNGDSGIDNISDDSFPDECPMDSEKTDPEPSNPSTSQADESADGSRQSSSYLKRSAEENDEDLSDSRTSSTGGHKYPNYRSAAVIFKRVAFSDADSEECDDLDSDSGKEFFSSKSKHEPKGRSDLSGYSHHMRQKINRLPLPHTLKIFLNFSRPV